MEAPLLQAAALLSSLLDAANNPVSLSPEARAALGQLGARLGAVAAAAEPEAPAAATAMDVEGGGDKQEPQPQPVRWATTKSGPRDATLRVPYPVMAHIAGFLLPRRNEDKWTDFNALARTSRAWLAATRDDVIWRPLVEGMWGWTQHPPARAAWLKQEQEQGQGQGQQGMWVRLYRRLARTAFCLEPGGYRRRWQEDYVISFDIRDTAKGIVLFSESAPLAIYVDEAETRGYILRPLRNHEGDLLPHRITGEAAVPINFPAMSGPTGITWDRLLYQHPATLQLRTAPLRGRDAGVSIVACYLQVGARRQELRLDVRLLHLPSGKGTTLYSSRNRDSVYVHGEDGSDPVTISRPPPSSPTLFKVKWKYMRLPAASPFPRVHCQTYAGFTAAEETECKATVFHTGGQLPPEPPAWMHQNLFGFNDAWSVVMDFAEGEHEPAECDALRLVHRALQALPWTD